MIEPANAKGTLQAHILQALKTLFISKFTEAGSLGWGMEEAALFQ